MKKLKWESVNGQTALDEIYFRGLNMRHAACRMLMGIPYLDNAIFSTILIGTSLSDVDFGAETYL